MAGRDHLAQGWARLFGDDGDLGEYGDVTELEKVQIHSVHGVERPATGAPFILMKARKAGTLPDRARAAFAGLNTGAPLYDLVARSHRPEGGRIPARIAKSTDEKRYTLCCAYPAWRADSQTAADGRRDFASDGVTQQMCWDFAKGGQVGLWHEGGTIGQADVVENYLWPRGAQPWHIEKTAGGPAYTVYPDDWMLGLRWSPDAWELIKAGKVKGISIEGNASRRVPSLDAIQRLRERGAA